MRLLLFAPAVLLSMMHSSAFATTHSVADTPDYSGRPVLVGNPFANSEMVCWETPGSAYHVDYEEDWNCGPSLWNSGSADCGAALWAPCSGELTIVDPDPAGSGTAGRRLGLLCDPDMAGRRVEHRWYHLSSVDGDADLTRDVVPGDIAVGHRVLFGQMLATVGGSGAGVENYYSCHLHHEVFINGVRVPFDLDDRAASYQTSVLTLAPMPDWFALGQAVTIEVDTSAVAAPGRRLMVSIHETLPDGSTIWRANLMALDATTDLTTWSWTPQIGDWQATFDPDATYRIGVSVLGFPEVWAMSDDWALNQSSYAPPVFFVNPEGGEVYSPNTSYAVEVDTSGVSQSMLFGIRLVNEAGAWVDVDTQPSPTADGVVAVPFQVYEDLSIYGGPGMDYRFRAETHSGDVAYSGWFEIDIPNFTGVGGGGGLCQNGTFGDAWWSDSDGDGYGAGDMQLFCNHPGTGFTASGPIDCDDDDPSVGDEREPYFQDDDADGVGAGDPVYACPEAAATLGLVPTGDDCDDANPDAYPGRQETCDGTDTDCDGRVDRPAPPGAPLWASDEDGDGFPDGTTVGVECAPPTGFVSAVLPADCRPQDPASFPGAFEFCDHEDNNCDGQIDEGLNLPLFFDNDEDGFGLGMSGDSFCIGESVPPGRATIDGDCTNGDPAINPDAPEICDGIDNNCNGLIDDACICAADVDGDDVCDASDLCFGDDASGDSDGDGTCDDLDLMLQATEAYAGDLLSFSTTGAAPGSTVHLLVASSSGLTCHPSAVTPLGEPVCVELTSPVVLGVSNADTAGVSTWSVRVPRSLRPPTTFYAQAVQLDGSVGDVSQLVDITVQPRP